MKLKYFLGSGRGG